MGTICACLPTLGPLFRGKHSLGSLIGSIRSYLGIGSQGRHSESNVNQSHRFEISKSPPNTSNQSYRQMPDDAILLTSIHGRQLEDVESRGSVEEGIHVQTKISTIESERHPQESKTIIQ